jgi:hypothetical protein
VCGSAGGPHSCVGEIHFNCLSKQSLTAQP